MPLRSNQHPESKAHRGPDETNEGYSFPFFPVMEPMPSMSPSARHKGAPLKIVTVMSLAIINSVTVNANHGHTKKNNKTAF